MSRLQGKQRKLLVDIIVSKLPASDAIARLEDLLAFSDVPNKQQVRRRLDPFGFTLQIVEHCEAYGADDEVDAMDALLVAITTVLGGWTSSERERLYELAIVPPAKRAGVPRLDEPAEPPRPRLPSIFFCHNSRDKPTIRRLAESVSSLAVSPWLDENRLAPGDRFARIVDRAMADAALALVFAGPHGIGSWQELEILALIRHSADRKLRVVPVILEGAQGSPTWPSFLDDLHRIDFRVDQPDPLAKLIEVVESVRAVAVAPR